MSKIVFATLGSLGDLYPQIALAIELRRRGHDIVFAVMQEYGEIVGELGFEFWLMRPDSSIWDHFLPCWPHLSLTGILG